MNIDTARNIDFWVGVPVCALASAVIRIPKLFRRAVPRPVRRVLFIGLSEVGSTVLAGPAMRKARDQLQAELFFLTSGANRASVDLTGMVQPANVFEIRIDSPGHFARDTLAFLAWARRNAIDTAIDLELFSRFSALLAGCCGAERTVGFHRFHSEGLYRGEMLTHRVTYNPHIHIAKGFISLVNALLSREATVPYSKTLISDAELRFSIPPPDLAARESMVERVRALVPGYGLSKNRLVLLNPNSGDLLPVRRWPIERYGELARKILQEHDDVAVLVTGAPSDRDTAARLVADVDSPRCVSLAGFTSLADLPALYALAAVMVTNDSGPAHIASAAGLPTIVLFGPETPRLYGPLGTARALYAGLACSPCATAFNHRKTACTDNVCMKLISVAAVYSEIGSVLSQAIPSREAAA